MGAEAEAALEVGTEGQDRLTMKKNNFILARAL